MDSLEITRRIQAAGAEMVAALRQAVTEDLPVHSLAREEMEAEEGLTDGIGRSSERFDHDHEY